ncbi:cation:proton antiporter [candidate division WOR-1 bacterium DG_54_3]|uniref:Cation:proton antiporter n=1 Tax=candidate division WOR-1 bacterium DG_54_3 TaxID=1703775 RepID=A0A0S7Y5H2_UNCSA|nr:MAG: cation:proton antiporter [candidate division WOR-1 bacterium DG_54_3]
MVYFLCFLLFLIGLYCIVTKKNLLKIIIGLVIVEYAVNLFLVLLGYKTGGHAPIINLAAPDWIYVDPLPQALVLTSIVIGLAVLALVVAIAMRIYERYGTFDITQIRKLRG